MAKIYVGSLAVTANRPRGFGRSLRVNEAQDKPRSGGDGGYGVGGNRGGYGGGR